VLNTAAYMYLSEPLPGKLLPFSKLCWRRPMAPGARREFAAAALEVLLAQVQPYAAAFQPPSVAAPSAPVQRSTHSPEGVPDALRQEAGGWMGQVTTGGGPCVVRTA
jgi:hypothetical protein